MPYELLIFRTGSEKNSSVPNDKWSDYCYFCARMIQVTYREYTVGRHLLSCWIGDDHYWYIAPPGEEKTKDYKVYKEFLEGVDELGGRMKGDGGLKAEVVAQSRRNRLAEILKTHVMRDFEIPRKGTKARNIFDAAVILWDMDRKRLITIKEGVRKVMDDN